MRLCSYCNGRTISAFMMMMMMVMMMKSYFTAYSYSLNVLIAHNANTILVAALHELYNAFYTLLIRVQLCYLDI